MTRYPENETRPQIWIGGAWRDACPMCHGTGVVPDLSESRPVMHAKCPRCKGMTYLPADMPQEQTA